ncbi:MAG: hypothetical protein AB7T49_05855 [Oligoflexales bacterium]
MVFLILALTVHFIWEYRQRKISSLTELLRVTNELLTHYKSGNAGPYAAAGVFKCIAEDVTLDQKRGIPIIGALEAFREECERMLDILSDAKRSLRLLCAKLMGVLTIIGIVRMSFARSVGVMNSADLLALSLGALCLAGAFSLYLGFLPTELREVRPTSALDWFRGCLKGRRDTLRAYKSGVSEAEAGKSLQRRLLRDSRAEVALKVKKWQEFQPLLELIWSLIAAFCSLGLPLFAALGAS